MDQYVDDYIPLLAGSGQRRALDILLDARVSQSNIEALVNNLVVKSDLRSLILSKDDFLGRISADSINSRFNNVFFEFSDMYEKSNTISTIIASYADVLNSEISSLNKEIDLIEKSISNYAFLLADAKAYNHAFLEPFSDTEFFDAVDFVVPDRSGNEFQAFETASVNAGDGTLIISGDLRRSFSLLPSIVTSNFIVPVNNQGSQITDSVSKDAAKSWKLSAKSPIPLSSTPPEFEALYGETYGGALMVIDYELSQSAPCDTLSIDPVVGDDFQLIQAVVYYNDDLATTKSLLTEPKKINQKTSLYFELKPIKKIRCFFRQGMYTRKHREDTGLASTLKELENHASRNLSSEIDRRLIHEDMQHPAKTNLSGSVSRFSFDIGPDGKVANNTLRPAYERVDSFGMGNKAAETVLSDTASRSGIMSGMSLFDMEQAENAGRSDVSDDYRPVEELGRITNSEKNLTPARTNSYMYEYVFGIRNVAIGASVDKFRSVYVSKKLPAPGDTGEVRMNAAFVDGVDAALDNPYITSVEFSVTNVSKPEREDDWIPILPSGQALVDSERLFFSTTGYAKFRFHPSYNDNVLIYKNGLTFNLEKYGRFVLNDSNDIIGVYVSPVYYTSRDIFTCYYLPAGDVNLVNFEAAGFDVPPLVSAYDIDGPGEGFNSTANQTSINISNEPFIDYYQAKSVEYSSTYGMIGYTPITIRLEDGTLAYNLTNYVLPQSQAALDPASENITFLQAGKNIIFNRAIAGKFRVYYQYLPSTVRVRVVLRTNSKQFATPKVDFYQLKSKIRLANSINNI